MNFLWVALGGALGAMARYGVSLSMLRVATVGWATFGVNMVGSFFLGVIVAMTPRFGLSNNQICFFAIGLLGSFTTFSAFSFELVQFFQQGFLAKALCYAVLSVVLGVGVAYLGYQAGQHVV